MFLQSMKIETSDVKRLFKMLDQDCSGEIMVDEFVNGCMHLQGSARNFDVHRLLAGQRRLQRRLDELSQAVGLQRTYSTGSSRFPDVVMEEPAPARELMDVTVDIEAIGEQHLDR